jgi:hypothetical protein
MPKPEIPSSLLKLVEKYFAESDRPKAMAILTSYAQRFPQLKDLERVKLDMVIVAKGDLARLGRQAERDYRDVIMEAEYELRDGKIVKCTNYD